MKSLLPSKVLYARKISKITGSRTFTPIFHWSGMVKWFFLICRVKWSNTITSILEDGKNATFTVHVPPLPSYAMMIPMFLNIVQWYHHEKNFYPEVASTEAELLHHQVVEAMKHTFAQKARLDNKNSISVYVRKLLLSYKIKYYFCRSFIIF